jgi:ATP synthase protein I
MSSIKAPPIYKVSAFQLLFLLVLCAAAAILTDWINAYSLLIGGLISALPGALFAKKVFRYRGARSTELIVKEMYSGEAQKLVLMGAGFAVSFIFVEPLNAMALFSGFVLVHITGVLMFVRVSTTDRINP